MDDAGAFVDLSGSMLGADIVLCLSEGCSTGNLLESRDMEK